MLYYIELAFGLSLYNYIGNRWLGHSGLAMYDNTARMHDPLLMRFVSSDPLYAKFGSLSPWSHCAANPLNLIDPDGNAAIYYNGEYIGSDGVDDDRTLIIPDDNTTIYADGNISTKSVGYSKEFTEAIVNFVKQNSGKKEVFQKDKHINKVLIEIPGGTKSIQDMSDDLAQYNSTDPDKNREFGGVITNTEYYPSEPGPPVNSDTKRAGITIKNAGNRSTVHSHPFGFNQLPSSEDYIGNSNVIHYVVGMENNMIYIHNDQGILASLSYKNFLEWFGVVQ